VVDMQKFPVLQDSRDPWTATNTPLSTQNSGIGAEIVAEA